MELGARFTILVELLRGAPRKGVSYLLVELGGNYPPLTIGYTHTSSSTGSFCSSSSSPLTGRQKKRMRIIFRRGKEVAPPTFALCFSSPLGLSWPDTVDPVLLDLFHNLLLYPWGKVSFASTLDCSHWSSYSLRCGRCRAISSRPRGAMANSVAGHMATQTAPGWRTARPS